MLVIGQMIDALKSGNYDTDHIALAITQTADETSKELIEAYGKVMELDAACILAGNGSDEMLGFLIQYFLGKDKKLYTLQPR